MSLIYLIVGGSLLAAELALVYELRQARKEIRAIRNDVPKWVGASIAIQALIAAVKKRGD